MDQEHVGTMADTLYPGLLILSPEEGLVSRIDRADDRGQGGDAPWIRAS